MRSHLVGVSSLVAQGSDSYRTVSESSRTRKWYETFNAAMKKEVETATFCCECLKTMAVSQFGL